MEYNAYSELVERSPVACGPPAIHISCAHLDHNGSERESEKIGEASDFVIENGAFYEETGSERVNAWDDDRESFAI
jgi:hypothetical protein